MQAYEDLIAAGRCRLVAMSVFASGALPPQEALEFVCQFPQIESIVFGASSRRNIAQTKQLIDRVDAPLARVRRWTAPHSKTRTWGMNRKVRLLNVDVDDITMDELVENFREGVMLTLHVDSIMKLQKDRDFYRSAAEIRRGHLRQPDPGRRGRGCSALR